MKITGIKGYLISLPLRSAFITEGFEHYSGQLYRNASDAVLEKWGLENSSYSNKMTYLVSVQTDEGIFGYGEVASINGARGLLKLAAENIIGMDVSDVSYIVQEKMLGRNNTKDNKSRNPDLPMRKEMIGIEFALWDAIGKQTGQPVYNLIGGKTREKVAIASTIGIKPIEECLNDIRQAINEGIRTIKIHVGAHDKRDVELLKEIRNEFGYDLILRVAPSSAWGLSGITDAVRILKQIEPYNIQYIEGPLNRTDGESFKRLREMTGIPVCMSDQFNGNHVMTTHDALVKLAELIRMDAIDVLGVNPSMTGGLYGFMKIAAFCEGAGIEIVAHRACGGLFQSVVLTGCITAYATSYAHDIIIFPQPSSVKEDIVLEPLIHKDGFMVPPDAPGWGLEPNWDVIHKHCIETEVAGNIQ